MVLWTAGRVMVFTLLPCFTPYSSMGMKVMFRELKCLAGILRRVRFRRKRRKEETK